MIADAGGIAKAAGPDAARQSLFSRQIKELEEYFGVELTHRCGKGIELTPMGKKLAQIVRSHLKELTDFSKECQREPIHISIAAGNSLLEWLILPRLAAVNEVLPQASFQLHNERSRDIVRRLGDMSVDFGLVRKEALGRPLKARSLGVLSYALYVPSALVGKKTAPPYEAMISELPLALGTGGVFRETLERESRKRKITLNTRLQCSSFTQAVSALKTGAYVAVLPRVMETQLGSQDNILIFDLPLLQTLNREICLAWNPRAASVRPVIAHGADKLPDLLSLSLR